MFFDSDPELPWITLVLGASSLIAISVDRLRYEDHERFRAGDFWRTAALLSFACAPWLALPLAWPAFTTGLGFKVGLPFLIFPIVPAYVVAILARPFRAPDVRRRLLRAAASLWGAGALVVSLGFCLTFHRAGQWIVGLGLGAPSALACLWLARRFWIQPPEPHRHRIDLTPASPSGD
ncbi:MAG: hypothetical protein ACOY9C_15905 [Pseudomonadota bacterium]